MCVKECPDKYWQYYTQIAEEEAGTRSYTDRDDMICKYDIDPESSEYSVSLTYIYKFCVSKVNIYRTLHATQCYCRSIHLTFVTSFIGFV